MKSANMNATDESIVAKRVASRLPSKVSRHFRVCTTDECRYKLCGITVAPRIPIAMYNMSGSPRISGRETNPTARSPRYWFGQPELDRK